MQSSDRLIIHTACSFSILIHYYYYYNNVHHHHLFRITFTFFFLFNSDMTSTTYNVEYNIDLLLTNTDMEHGL